MMIVMFLKEIFDAYQMFKWYLATLEKGTCKSLKCLRSYSGGEFISDEFNIFYNDKGIKRQMSAPRTPPKNRIIERRNRSIMDCAMTLMMEKNVSQTYWREAVSTAVYTLN
jgi:transposase InsO family protein